MEEPGGNDAAHDPFALMLGLALATTAHAKPDKGQVKFDANAPVAEQIRNVETAINTEDYSEIGLEDKAAHSRRWAASRSRWATTNGWSS